MKSDTDRMWFRRCLLLLAWLGTISLLHTLLTHHQPHMKIHSLARRGGGYFRPAAVEKPLSPDEEQLIMSKLDELEEILAMSNATGGEILHAGPITYDETIAVLILACNRATVRRNLDSILKYKPKDRFPVIISQDCGHQETADVSNEYRDHILFLQHPDLGEPAMEKGHEAYVQYYKISRHYKWALSQVFDVLQYDQVIVVEDDMEVTPDFFDYFEAFLPLLHADTSLFCISSWNDNGKPALAHDEEAFYRSDFFPGLGWMLTRRLWMEIQDEWPRAFWDDWLRDNERRRDRACIRPEISRTTNFGKWGVSGGQYFEEHIGKIIGNSRRVHYANWGDSPNGGGSESSGVNVFGYRKDVYDAKFRREVMEWSTEVTSRELRTLLADPNPRENLLYSENANLHRSPCGADCTRRYRIPYSTLDANGSVDRDRLALVALAGEWELMTDVRAGLMRTEYLGIICFKTKFMNVHPEEWAHVCLAPMENLEPASGSNVARNGITSSVSR